MSVHYEWRFEEIDEYGDIVDIAVEDESLKKLLDIGVDPDKMYQLVLIRDSEGDVGSCNTTYAYIKHGKKLPERFSSTFDEDDKTIIPKRYRDEFERNKTRIIGEWCSRF